MNGDQQNNMFQPGMNTPERKSSMVGTVIVILIVVIGIIYLLASRNNPTPANTTPINTVTENPTNITGNNVEIPSTADGLTGLEAELDATNLNEADASIDQFDNELNQ